MTQVVDREKVRSSVHFKAISVGLRTVDGGHRLAMAFFAVNRVDLVVYGIMEYFEFDISNGQMVVYGDGGAMIRSVRDEQLIRFGMAIEQADFLIAHGVAEIKPEFLEMIRPASAKLWLCSKRMIDWTRHGAADATLPAIAKAVGVDVPGDSAMEEAITVVEVLSKLDGTTGQSLCGLILKKAGIAV